jgi:hypothetical protein
VRRVRDINAERGGVTIEYSGVLLAGGAVVLALVTAAPSIGADIAGGITGATCEVTGETCSEDGGDEGSEPPLDPPPEPSERAEPGQECPQDPELPGNCSEQRTTATPLPPAGDQCSWAPDEGSIGGISALTLYDFSYACYGHDLCWQNGSYEGERKTRHQCNEIFHEKMREHCNERHTGFGSGFAENRCFDVAECYYIAVEAASAADTELGEAPDIIRDALGKCNPLSECSRREVVSAGEFSASAPPAGSPRAAARTGS